MKKYKIIVLFLAILFLGCQSPKKNHDFIFFKWSLHECYYLKFNSTDTLYIINTFPIKQTSYTILNKEEKEKIQGTLDDISFPKETEYVNSGIDDGVTYAFSLKNGKQLKKLTIHGDIGPDRFWLFGKSLEDIKNQNSFTRINKKFDLKSIDEMVIVPAIFIEK